jgi:tetratricopeptide (TPR) repeat protein/TolB-like protein
MRHRYVLIFIFALIFSFQTAAAQTAGTPTQAQDRIMVLPFENTSNLREYNWVGESFADALAELLEVPGLAVVAPDEREIAYQRLGLPLTTIPTRATSIRLAREAGATHVVIGTYDVTPPQGETVPATIRGTARVIAVNEGRLTGEVLDGRWAWRPYDFGGPLGTLQNMQGRIAYQVLYQRDRALPFSMNQFIERATTVPPRAFESYVKGLITADPERQSAYLQNAMREFERVNAGAVYTQAAFELGHLFFRQRNWERAAENFSKLTRRDRRYSEAAFYAALSYWRMNDLQRALGALMPVAADTPMTGIYNNAGAISTQAARSERNETERARLLSQATTFLGRAAESTPDDPIVRFNYAYALFLSGNHAGAVEQLRPVIASNPRDGEALFLFAKSLERTNATEAATAADNEARRHLPNYARWQTEWQRSQTVTDVPLRLHQDFNRFSYYEARRVRPSGDTERTATQDLIANARTLYAAGRDDEALPELRRVLTSEPMNAEAYLLIGRINQRRGEIDSAISVLRTALFWDARLIDAHVLLGRIFLERGDRAQALVHARNAVSIDANNQDAIALMRQVETSGR